MTHPDITPADLAHWKAVCEAIKRAGLGMVVTASSRDYSLPQGCLIVTADSRPLTEEDIADFWKARTFLPCLLAAYERVVKENMKLEEGVAELQDLEERLVIQRDRLTAEVDRLSHGQYALVWEIVKTLNLGAGGCPDSLIIDEVRRLRGDHDRLTAQLALEQTASNRTIEHLVARKDVIEGEREAFRITLERVEAQYTILSEQSRITLEMGAKRQEALEAQVMTLEADRDSWQRQCDDHSETLVRVSDERDALRVALNDVIEVTE